MLGYLYFKKTNMIPFDIKLNVFALVLMILIKPITVRRQVETDSIFPSKTSFLGQDLFRHRRSHLSSFLPVHLPLEDHLCLTAGSCSHPNTAVLGKL